MYNLKIIIASTRPGRKGPFLGSWIYNVAKRVMDFNVELLDLAEINLPFLDEENHPKLRKYVHQHTKDWSEKIADADAFIFVTPEYNAGFPAALKNAIDFLYSEWNYKPVAFVSYGGISAGARSVQMMKQVVTTLNMMPIAQGVNVPLFMKYIDSHNHFVPDEETEKFAEIMLNELLKWSDALKVLRQNAEPIN
jgi:NAD(P)H-dependent FMN reductase